jgi:hypothetical protein
MRFAPILLAALLCSCSTDQPNTTHPSKPLPPEQRPKPTLGMTKDEIRAQYGQPKRITQTPKGEMWHYNNSELAAIPFNFGFKLKWHQFTFDEQGKLIDFQVDDF